MRPDTVTVSPGFLSVILSMVTDVGAAVTVTEHVAVFPPSAVVTVIVAVPGATADTTPALSTVATDGSSDEKVTVLFAAFVGNTVAVKNPFVPDTRLSVVLFNVTSVTGTGGATTLNVFVATVVPIPATTVYFPIAASNGIVNVSE